MSTMGKYCKAYLAQEFRQYPQWSKSEIADDEILYLQENYVVTSNIFKDEQILFDQVTSEWQDFCHQVLKFEIPDYVSTGAES
jgi:hypothetical protein